MKTPLLQSQQTAEQHLRSEPTFFLLSSRVRSKSQVVSTMQACSKKRKKETDACPYFIEIVLKLNNSKTFQFWLETISSSCFLSLSSRQHHAVKELNFQLEYCHYSHSHHRKQSQFWRFTVDNRPYYLPFSLSAQRDEMWQWLLFLHLKIFVKEKINIFIVCFAKANLKK